MTHPASLLYVRKSNEKVVAAIAQQVGFESIEPHALSHLSDLLGTYLERLLTSTHSYAELSNHTRPNYHDITKALLKANADIPELCQYAQRYYTTALHPCFTLDPSNDSTIETIPDFLPSDDDDDEDDKEGAEQGHAGASSYVPSFLPPFPSKHSFRHTPVYIDRPDNAQYVRELNSQQSRTVEENLKRLMAKETEILRESEMSNKNKSSLDVKNIIPMVNYEVSLQRRKRAKLNKLE
ncbi:hypothetical protein DM01DRAFT_1405552 [Hesseltinella vesiculosa]|uniref:Transcription initiation factor TFIID subunit 8 n=1 Tax=Hesseltinella vesiculosa TaxID=101127 RepID=A0A1X2GQC2_9FUNG|nr:hypothetical protein DM01DRAFT_1405552 [Hesseltinella vesiculosa]